MPIGQSCAMRHHPAEIRESFLAKIISNWFQSPKIIRVMDSITLGSLHLRQCFPALVSPRSDLAWWASTRLGLSTPSSLVKHLFFFHLSPRLVLKVESHWIRNRFCYILYLHLYLFFLCICLCLCICLFHCLFLARSCLLITLIKCLNGSKSLGMLFVWQK